MAEIAAEVLTSPYGRAKAIRHDLQEINHAIEALSAACALDLTPEMAAHLLDHVQMMVTWARGRRAQVVAEAQRDAEAREFLDDVLGRPNETFFPLPDGGIGRLVDVSSGYPTPEEVERRFENRLRALVVNAIYAAQHAAIQTLRRRRRKPLALMAGRAES